MARKHKVMKKSHMNPIVKGILSAASVAFFGLILLNLAFIFDALYQNTVRGVVGIFVPLGPELGLYWFPPLMHLSFLVVVGIISWFIFRSKLWTLAKAIYLSVPVAAVLVTAGMFLNHWPVLAFSVGTLLCVITLYYFYRTKQPWIYYFTVIFWAIVLAVFTLMGGEI